MKNRFGSWDEIEKIIQPNTMLFMQEYMQMMIEVEMISEHYQNKTPEELVEVMRENYYSNLVKSEEDDE